MIETLAEVIGKDRRGGDFCVGLVLWDDVVVKAAPIVHRLFKGKSRSFVRAYCRERGWTVTVVHELRRADAQR